MPAVQMRFPRDYLDRRLITADRTAMGRAVVQIEREAATIADPKGVRLLEHVRNELSLGNEGYPGLEVVASRLGMSTRTLKRKLNDRGTGFREILDEVRQRDAERQLANPDLEIQQIATVLGYTDPPSFTRAFRRWNGTPPSRARQQLLGTKHLV